VPGAKRIRGFLGELESLKSCLGRVGFVQYLGPSNRQLLRVLSLAQTCPFPTPRPPENRRKSFQASTPRLVVAKHKRSYLERALYHSKLTLIELEINNLPGLRFFPGQLRRLNCGIANRRDDKLCLLNYRLLPRGNLRPTQLPQVKRDGACGLKALIRVLFHAVVNDMVPRWRDFLVCLDEFPRVVIQDGAQDIGGRVTLECPALLRRIWRKNRSGAADLFLVS
jgi:hypothetical protein